VTTTLPTWDEMSDVDKGAALLHLHKRDSEGADYAVENYPVVYYDDPRLTALESREACRHAVSVSRDADRISGKEHQRLCNLALDEPARRCLWAADDDVKPFRFADTWEWDFQDWDWWFLWACQGIKWAIGQYDALKASKVAEVASR
jgi:hypothetical protein